MTSRSVSLASFDLVLVSFVSIKNREHSVLGTDEATVGAIPPLAEFQAQLWILAIQGLLPHSLIPNEHYKLHVSDGERIQYGVDHENYAYQLALDMESAPSFSHMLTRGPRLFLTWALGANFNTKFRLIGPWAFDGAQEIMRTELWGTITKRGGFFGRFCYAFLMKSLKPSAPVRLRRGKVLIRCCLQGSSSSRPSPFAY